ncbi:MAG: patatin-like phospholipase family protein [Microcoleaceae cyanobacterium]
MAKFTRILSIDGGGLRGLIPAQVLVYVEQQLQEKTGNPDARIADYFDLFAGTSAGGISSCLYLAPDPKTGNRPRYKAEDVVNFFLREGHRVFYKSLLHTIKNLGGFINEKYSHYEFQQLSSDFLGDLKLSELLKPCLITSYDIENRKTHFFTQHDAKIDQKQNYLVRDVLRATSAAPTFFEVAQIFSLNNETYHLVDGGVFANNPALCAYAEVRNKFNSASGLKMNRQKSPTAKEMAILSLGTGDVKKAYLYKQAKDWGNISWLIPLFDIIMTGVAETVDYQMRQIYDAIESPDQYLRINPILPKKGVLPIDDASQENLVAIQQLGKAQTLQCQKQLDQFIELLLL